MIDSGIGVKAGGMEIGNLCADLLEDMGFKIHRYSFEGCGDTIVGERGDMSKPFVMLLGHIDINFYEGEPQRRPFKIVDGKAYGPGVLDMKGGDLIALSGLKALHDAGFDFPCKVVFVADEEPAHKFSNNPEIISKEAKGAKCCFNFETGFPDHNITVQRKGSWRFFIETFGRGCHTGNDPQNGRSAILEMAHKIIEIEKLTDYSKNYNINVGTIEGGTVVNSAPAHCKVGVDFRYIDIKDKEEVEKKVKKIVDAVYVKDVTSKMYDDVGFIAMPRLDSSMELLKVAQEVAKENGWPVPGPKLCGGASDAAYTTTVGVPSLCSMGVEGARNHTVEEWADVESLFTRTKLLIGILLKVAE